MVFLVPGKPSTCVSMSPNLGPHESTWVITWSRLGELRDFLAVAMAERAIVNGAGSFSASRLRGEIHFFPKNISEHIKSRWTPTFTFLLLRNIPRSFQITSRRVKPRWGTDLAEGYVDVCDCPRGGSRADWNGRTFDWFIRHHKTNVIGSQATNVGIDHKGIGIQPLGHLSSFVN